jgi:hypothetical protein
MRLHVLHRTGYLRYRYSTGSSRRPVPREVGRHWIQVTGLFGVPDGVNADLSVRDEEYADPTLAGGKP